MNAQQIKILFTRFHQANPQPQTELEYQSPYQLLVAVILSAQATDKSVNRATRTLFQIAPDAKSMVKINESQLQKYLQTIGLYRNKAKNILAMSQQLLTLHQGEVPRERIALEALPGVGRKTANVILNTLFGEAVIAVDTHLFRLANRMGLAPGKDVQAVEKNLMKKIPAAFRLHAHHWLILHGRYICTARHPKCSQCLAQDICDYTQKKNPPTA
jgi:endonuclease-3